MAKSKDTKPAKGDTKGNNKADKSSSKKTGGKGGGKADADSSETKSTKLKGAMTINVRHILVSLTISRPVNPLQDD